MKLTNFTNYALRILQFAALRDPDHVRMEDVARAHSAMPRQRRLNEPAPAFEAPDHPRRQDARGLPRQVAGAVLPPGGLHPGVHHRVHRLRQAPGRLPASTASCSACPSTALLAHRLGAEHQGEFRRRDRLPDHRRPVHAGGQRLRHDPARRQRHLGGARHLHHRPEGVLRAMVYYPMSNGRSIDEFVRLVKALQTSDACTRSRRPRAGSRATR
jgi:hypothetical protein